MKELLRWETDDGPVVIEVDSSDLGSNSIARKPGAEIIEVKERFEGALDRVRTAAVSALKTFRDKSLAPDEVDLEFGVKLVPAIGPSTENAPYFFLSYAHTPRLDASDSTDPDLWVEQLFKDLCRHIVQVTDLPRGSNPGFMDKNLHPGENRPESLIQALATCRVFVPLYSRRYFTSVDCG